jgi:hypothetical protein
VTNANELSGNNVSFILVDDVAGAGVYPDAIPCDCPPGMCLGDAGDIDTSGPFVGGDLAYTGTATFEGLEPAYLGPSKTVIVSQLARAAENLGLALAGITRLAEEAFED